MQRSHVLKSALIGLGLVGFAASQASAATIYTTNFDAPTFGAGVALAGQNGWVGAVNAGSPGSNVPNAGTFTYAPATNPQYALLTVINNAPASSGFYNPTHAAYNYTGSGDSAVAITFSMNVLSGYSLAAATDEFFGVSAFGAPTGSGELASLGLNNRTGQYVLPVGATVVNSSPFGLGAAGLGTYRGYELLLDFATQKWSIYSQLTPGVSAYTLDAYGSFANASTTFTDADLAAFNLSTGASNGYAQFDDYTVQTLVPEPTSLAVAGLASGLLLGRRRRSM